MEKIFDRLLIEFLIPAFLMLVCMIFIADVVMGDSFDSKSLFKYEHRDFILIIGSIFAYVINTSISSLFNLISRILLWGKVREYLMYRKLNIFKEAEFEKRKIWLFYYLRKRNELKKTIDKVKEKEAKNLFPELKEKLKEWNVPEHCSDSILDIYDFIRTIVMASKDSAIISWIQYHWAQLRLARNTLVPTFLLIFFLPAAIHSWHIYTWPTTLLAAILSFCFFILQLCHYYYRERFMIYAMLGYFLICKTGDKMKAEKNQIKKTI